jgi:hypothetical protein
MDCMHLSSDRFAQEAGTTNAWSRTATLATTAATPFHLLVLLFPFITARCMQPCVYTRHGARKHTLTEAVAAAGSVEVAVHCVYVC